MVYHIKPGDHSLNLFSEQICEFEIETLRNANDRIGAVRLVDIENLGNSALNSRSIISFMFLSQQVNSRRILKVSISMKNIVSEGQIANIVSEFDYKTIHEKSNSSIIKSMWGKLFAQVQQQGTHER